MRTVTLAQFLDSNKKLAHTRKPLQRATSLPVVDLYAGAGGFSTGAAAAGHRVQLVVDGWYDALQCHGKNHPDAEHHYAWMPDDSLLDKLPSPDTLWHLHGSPPCQKLSSVNTGTKSKDGSVASGLENVDWYLNLALTRRPASWTMEQVAHPAVIQLLQHHAKQNPGFLDYEVCKMEEWGVPQARRRVIAGSPFLIRRLRDKRAPLSTCGVKRACQHLGTVPPEAIGIKGSNMHKYVNDPDGAKRHKRSGVTCAEARMKRGGGLAHPGPTVLCSNMLSWCTLGGETIRSLTLKEHAALQTFPNDYHFSTNRQISQTLCGNAVPPKFAEILMSDYRLPAERGALAHAEFPERPRSPSLNW